MNCLSAASMATLGFCACSLAPGGTSLQDTVVEPCLVSPNRPTFSDGTALVPHHHLQIETGWTFTQRDQGGTETGRHNAPEVVGRYRVFDALEARLTWGGHAWIDSESGGTSTKDDGNTDFALGILVPIVEQEGWLPALVLEATTTLGVGADNLSSGHGDPTIKLLWSYSGGQLPDWLAIGGNLIASYPTENGDRFSQTAASLVVSVSPTGTDTSCFAEWYVVAPYANNLDEAHTADFGVVQRLSRTTAADARFGFGLDDDADDWFTGVGFSVLF